MSKKTIIFFFVISIFLFISIFTILLLSFYKRTALESTEVGYGTGGPSYTMDMLYSNMGHLDSSLTKENLINNEDGSKLQKTGNISFLVKDLDKSVNSAKTINTKYSAQITNIYDYGRGNDRIVQLTIKVPVTEFEKYYEELRDLDGEVTYANISTTDVTEEYIDITSRLKNLKSVETQLVGILEKAESITDILAVQRELNTTRGEIESYEQRKRYFDSQTDYSYVTLSFSIDKEGISISDEPWKPSGEFKMALNALVSVLKGLVNLTIWILVFSPLLLIPLGIVFYIVKHKGSKK